MTIRTRITLLYAGTATAAGLALYFLISAWLPEPAGSGLLPLAIAALLVLAAALGTGWFVAGRVLAPLRRITGLAERISAGHPHGRIEQPGPPDELQRLAGTVNGLLARLETATTAQRRFAANVAHELRTPLATSRTLLEVAAAHPERCDLPDLTAKLRTVNERGTELVDALLDLARAEHGLTNPVPTDLAVIAAQALANLDPGGVTVSAELAATTFPGEPILLLRLVNTLLANAIRHNRPGGRARVTVADGRLTVTNTGPLIPAELAGQLFEPFVRSAGRTRPAGHGLGLAIARAVVTAHHGTITASPNPDGGLTVDVRF
ncbi:MULTISPECIES: HAMP domain-containing sensor histidine kinase [unclassified Crossiella]|uniref:sensor histidine kinase n=1 Tax=unclassified Crossiella TaxID=2620835 RepID=UPI0020000A5B|nr:MULTISPECIES: ATP-binding protein [unclassified Crossiella]MCK2237798.1 ATP-binding protein [Crossiella sp. S99.2]MCK2255084.1 ATP-binding protein [Crossiella sp. S99.1]